MNRDNILVAKPRITGVIFHAALGTTLPTTADETLSTTDFKDVGYIEESGVKYNRSRSNTKIKEMGAKNVRELQTEYSEECNFTMLEYLNEEALKVSYGNDNVSGSLASGLTIKSKAESISRGVFVIDCVDENILTRHVIPDAEVTETGEESFGAAGASMLPVKLSAHPFINTNAGWNGEYHKKFIKKTSTPVPPADGPNEEDTGDNNENTEGNGEK